MVFGGAITPTLSAPTYSHLYQGAKLANNFLAPQINREVALAINKQLFTKQIINKLI